MITIQEYLKNKLGYKVADLLGVTPPMISKYKNRGSIPELKTARKIYQYDGTVLFPYSEEALSLEEDNA